MDTAEALGRIGVKLISIPKEVNMSAAWKDLERKVAAALGGRRNVSKGLGGPDVLDVPGWLIECKYRATFTHDAIYRAERAKRRKELHGGTRFALVTRARGQEPLVVVALADFAALVQNERTEETNPCESSPALV